MYFPWSPSWMIRSYLFSKVLDDVDSNEVIDVQLLCCGAGLIAVEEYVKILIGNTDDLHLHDIGFASGVHVNIEVKLLTLDSVNMKLKLLLAVTSIVSVIGVPQASAQDLVAGEKIYKKTCKACHGPTAKGMASFPKLAGHPAGYLAMRLAQYKKGEKVGPNTPLMAPQAAKLSEEDVANVTNYIATKFN
ncbi:MAG: cytochrome c [Roseibium sp.]